MHPVRQRIRRRGLRAIEQEHLGPPEFVAGLPVEPAAETLAKCSRDLSETDVACLVAAALSEQDCNLAQLEQVATRPQRGIRKLRRVLTRTVGCFESIWEVMLAELHHCCEIEVVPQFKVFHDDTGEFVARGDLWLTGTRRLHEYDGGVHRDRRQHRADLQRDAALDRAGWTRRGYTSKEVLHQAVRILADADDAIGRVHEPSRIRLWHEFVKDSLFTPSGRAQLLRRVASPGC